MKNRYLLSLLLLPAMALAGCTSSRPMSGPAEQVDMFMATFNDSYGVVGPQLPHGSVNPSPQTPNGDNGGYHVDQPIRGFGQLHVSGTGWGRYGQIFLSPQTGFAPGETDHDSEKSEEIAKPYYYGVTLDRYKVRAELTPTHHAVAYRFTFPGEGDPNILLDIAHNLPQHIAPQIRGRFMGGEINYNEATGEISGWGRYRGGFAAGDPYNVYFTLTLDQKPESVAVTENGVEALYAQIKLPEKTGTVNLNIGVSMRSVENSRKYLAEEIGTRTLEQIKEAAHKAWNDQLGVITFEGGTEAEQRLFYTALYHSFVMPRERTGDNPNWESDLAHLDDHYCVWDTFRTKYPLMILLQESFVSKTIQSFIDRFAHNGICNPSFVSSLEWSGKQGGDDVDNIIADAIVKGVKGFDEAKAYELAKWNAYHNRNEDYLKYGWIPDHGQIMGCSANLEFAYNDFCTAQIAERRGDDSTAKFLYERSKSWEKIFNPNLESGGYKGFTGPRKENGEWIEIDPAKVYGSWVEYFYEGNSWVYTHYVPHHFDRLIELCGGKDEMVKRLSYGFDAGVVEISNEPGFLAPFIFSHCGRPDLTAKYVAGFRKNEYSLTEGYPGNEDSGAMGSWYVFTSMGLFPNAGQDFYYLLPPSFSDMTVRMENGKTIRVQAERPTPEACYIQSVSLNGTPLDRPWIYHHEITGGATLNFVLTDQENAWKLNLD